MSKQNSFDQVITPDFTSHTVVEYPCNDSTHILQYTAPYSYVLPISHYPFQGIDSVIRINSRNKSRKPVNLPDQP